MAITRASDSSIQDGLPRFNDLWDGTTAVSSFDSLGSVTLTSSQNLITFNSIPQTYTHLQIRGFCNASASDLLLMRWNNISLANYGFHSLFGNGTTSGAGGGGGGTGIYISDASATAGRFSAIVIDILDYTNTTKYKTSKSLAGWDANGSGSVRLWSGTYYGATTAISRIDLSSPSSNMLANSSFSLYGIK